MSYEDDELSAEDSKPREVIQIDVGDPVVTTHYIATGKRDVLFGGQVYTALASARSELSQPGVGQARDMTITLPVDHALVTRYLLQGVPPRVITATITRIQKRSGESRQIWTGRITSMSVDGSVAKFRVPARTTEALLRVLPNITAGRHCPHMLYDNMCGISRAAFKVTTTLLYVNGRTVRLDIGSTDRVDWSKDGELVCEARGERQTIVSQTYVGLPSQVVEIEMQQPIPGLQAGDSVDVYAGCDKLITTCVGRFDNRQNFGGFNRMPSKNVWNPTDNGFDKTGEL